MRSAIGERQGMVGNPAPTFAKIGAFLKQHSLGIDPTTYAFAYEVIVNPDGALSRAVRERTDGGFRLTPEDLAELGQTGEFAGMTLTQEGEADDEAVSNRAQVQVEGMHAILDRAHGTTQRFKNDLNASVAAIRATTGDVQIAQVVEIIEQTSERAQTAEKELEAARSEARLLRHELEAARDDALRDPLTELPNRRAFEDAFADALGTESDIIVAICDVDKFKAVNDGFGHNVGDRILKAVATILSDQCENHLVARYGGEEFAILFVDTPADEAFARVDAARETLACKHYRVRENGEMVGNLSFSAGLTAHRPTEGFEGCFERADRLLYSAKETGRNRIRSDLPSLVA